jgi:N-acetylmuramoyl-L-alanine amidase
MKLIAALAVPVVLLMGQNGERAPYAVTAVRYWSLTNVTRVAIEISGPFKFRSERLHNPERVYFDIWKTRPRIDSNLYYTENVADKLLQRIRVAETTPQTTRVVLDLAGAVDATTSTLTSPDRLIIELRTPAGGVMHGTTPPTDTADHPTEPSSAPALPSFTPIPAPAIPPPITLAPPTVKPSATPILSAVSAVATAIAPPIAPAPAISAKKTGAAHSDVKAPEISADIPKPEEPETDNTAGHAAASTEETATGARHTSSGANSLIRALGLKINRVVIDPGHGGHDEGTEGPKALREKDLVLDVALRVGKLVQDRMGGSDLHPQRRHFRSTRAPHRHGQREKGRPLSVHPRQLVARSADCRCGNLLFEHQRQPGRHGRGSARKRPHPGLHLRFAGHYQEDRFAR